MAAVMSGGRSSSRKNSSARTKLSWNCILLFLLALVAGYVSLLFRLPTTSPLAKEAEAPSHLHPKNQPHYQPKSEVASLQGVEHHLGGYQKSFHERKNHKQPNQDDNHKNPNLLLPTKDGTGSSSGSVARQYNGIAAQYYNDVPPAATIRPTTNNEIDYWRLNHTAFYNISSDGTNVWDDPSETPKLPSWMKRYFNWHKHKRQTWSPETFDQDRWLIMQCLAGQDRKCGGTADRLKTVPWILRVAYYTRRIVLIRWTRPSMLENFLVPPVGGLDWRVPDWLVTIMDNSTNGKRLIPSGVIRQYSAGNMTFLRTRYQSFNGGSDWYDSHLLEGRTEPKFDEVFSDVWKTLFTPTPPIQTIVREELDRLHLVPGQYIGAHLRALYGIMNRDEQEVEDWTRNAIHCASNLRPGQPIFLASDSTHATEFAPGYVQKTLMKPVPVAVRVPNPNPSLHLDQSDGWVNRPPSDYYDTFVDLYLLALSKCVTYNKGGFGHWGLLIGGNVTCTKKHRWQSKGGICSWMPGDTTGHQEHIVEPMFLEPMP